MAKKATTASVRIRQEMNKLSLGGKELAEKSNISYFDLNNILSGKSNRVEKLDMIAKALGKPLEYFVNTDFQVADSNNSYDPELHYLIIKNVSNFCKQHDIDVDKTKMDKLVDFIYPRLKFDDPKELILSQIEIILEYALKNYGNI